MVSRKEEYFSFPSSS